MDNWVIRIRHEIWHRSWSRHFNLIHELFLEQKAQKKQSKCSKKKTSHSLEIHIYGINLTFRCGFAIWTLRLTKWLNIVHASKDFTMVLILIAHDYHWKVHAYYENLCSHAPNIIYFPWKQPLFLSNYYSNYHHQINLCTSQFTTFLNQESVAMFLHWRITGDSFYINQQWLVFRS